VHAAYQNLGGDMGPKSGSGKPSDQLSSPGALGLVLLDTDGTSHVLTPLITPTKLLQLALLCGFELLPVGVGHGVSKVVEFACPLQPLSAIHGYNFAIYIRSSVTD